MVENNGSMMVGWMVVDSGDIPAAIGDTPMCRLILAYAT